MHRNQHRIDVDDLPEALLDRPVYVPNAQSGVIGDSGPTFGDVPMPLEVALEVPERTIIEKALKRNNWSRQATAAELDVNRTTLYKKMRKYRLDVGEIN